MHKEIVFKLIEESGHLPRLPEDVSQILDIIKNPMEVDIDLLIDRVTRSGELHDLMLKNINSGYFRLKKEIKTVKEAIVYLGMQTVQNMLIFYITRQLFPDSMRESNRTFDIYKYWRHVLGTSVASCMLSSRINKGDKYELFSYGLIHDIGIVVLDACLPNHIDRITEKLISGVHQLIAERIILGGITHAEIGAWLCKKWNIREDIINIVEFHHAPFMAKSNIEVVRLIYAADVISTQYYERMLGVNLNHEISKKVMDSLGLTPEDVQAVVREFPSELEKVAYYFSV